MGLTPSEAAEYLGCSKRHFETVHAPFIPAADLATPGAKRRLLRFTTADLDAYIQTLKVRY